MLKIVRNCAQSTAGRQQVFRFNIRPLSILKHGLSSVQLEHELGIFPAVKLRGLPYNASLDDVTEFLNGLHPLDIVVPKDNENGSIGVLFCNINDAEAALERDKDTIGSRYIDVIRIPRMEFYRMAHDSVMSGAGGGGEGTEGNLQGADEGSVMKMSGLPFQACPRDIQHFFAGTVRLSHFSSHGSCIRCLLYSSLPALQSS
jgi:heterogeneous nuclear ribonucleoprotein F/H